MQGDPRLSDAACRICDCVNACDYAERLPRTRPRLDRLRQCSRDRLSTAGFEAVQLQNGRLPTPYLPVHAAGLAPGMPYICLRVPTGGGKTRRLVTPPALRCMNSSHAERAVVLWLVPSNTILDQTADALRDPRHPYRRQASELACGSVEVVTIEEALHLSRATVDGQTRSHRRNDTILRVEDTTGRKVYDQNGAFAEHLQNVSADRLTELLPGADGKPKPSLVNMLRLRRPIMIVDEAHNARTDLSFSTLGTYCRRALLSLPLLRRGRSIHPISRCTMFRQWN